MVRATLLLALMVPAVAFSSVSANDAVLNVQINANQVIASGVTRGGEVVFFGRTVRWQGGVRHLGRHAVVLTDEDRDGVVTLTLDEVLPRASAFVVVDFDSGAFVLASPAGFTPKQIELPSLVWRGGVSYIDLRREYLDVLFVRPRVGVWRAEMRQGGARDADGSNDANLRAALASMPPLLGTSQPPPTATRRDVIAIIDPRRLDVFVRNAE